jgi:hypothetical protein
VIKHNGPVILAVDQQHRNLDAVHVQDRGFRGKEHLVSASHGLGRNLCAVPAHTVRGEF